MKSEELMIDYHLKYYHTHSMSEHNINNFSFVDLYKFLHLGYTYVKNQENKSYKIVKDLPKQLPNHDYININHHVFLSYEEMNMIASLNYEEEICFKKEEELMMFCIYKHPERMIPHYTSEILKLNYNESE